MLVKPSRRMWSTRKIVAIELNQRRPRTDVEQGRIALFRAAIVAGKRPPPTVSRILTGRFWDPIFALMARTTAPPE
ncbi:hypothetical protein V7x_15300 [Crateriforma conspicua]|uniref:Uncharacterized protein n=1 Tax=Crateriforma conspicua TaxID=2527996 RepID=A0A5C6FUL5_9PLAN|nr:hypothetical protein V7x_15300 [Crateriforma conspicua]